MLAAGSCSHRFPSGHCARGTRRAMPPRPIQWVNTPVLLEAIERYERGQLPRPMQLWLEQVLELPTPAQDPQAGHGGAVAVVDVHHREPGGAAGEHAVQGGLAAGADAVAHRHWHADHRLGQ